MIDRLSTISTIIQAFPLFSLVSKLDNNSFLHCWVSRRPDFIWRMTEIHTSHNNLPIFLQYFAVWKADSLLHPHSLLQIQETTNQIEKERISLLFFFFLFLSLWMPTSFSLPARLYTSNFFFFLSSQTLRPPHSLEFLLWWSSLQCLGLGSCPHMNSWRIANLTLTTTVTGKMSYI